MCFGGGARREARRAREQAADIQAQITREEEERQNRIQAGREAIDENFARFDDKYFDDYQTAYVDNFTPQIDRQHEDARAGLIAALASRGMNESTVAGVQLGDLQQARDEQHLNVASRASDATQQLRTRVENAKGDLYTLNQAAADPASANTQALGRASSLVAPPEFSPIGQVFAGALDGYAAYRQAQNNIPESRVTAAHRTNGYSTRGNSQTIHG